MTVFFFNGQWFQFKIWEATTSFDPPVTPLILPISHLVVC